MDEQETTSLIDALYTIKPVYKKPTFRACLKRSPRRDVGHHLPRRLRFPGLSRKDMQMIAEVLANEEEPNDCLKAAAQGTRTAHNSVF